MKAFVSGLSCVETVLGVRGFPVTYYPVDYPFFGIRSYTAGSGYRIARGLAALGDDVDLLSLIGDDVSGERVLSDVRAAGLPDGNIRKSLKSTVEYVALQETPFGRRQVYCDLKNVQDVSVDVDDIRPSLERADVCVLCNVNYNRPLLSLAKSLGKPVITDVQNLSDINDGFNGEFIAAADILFLSDEGAPTAPRDFLAALAKKCTAKLIIMGLADEGVLCYDREAGATHALKAVPVGSVITAGAGAALLSGFVHYHGKYGTVEALKRAEVFAALKLAGNAAGGEYPDEQTVERKLSEAVFD